VKLNYLVGGTGASVGQYSGYIGSVGNIASVSLAGDLEGGAGSDSGEITAGGSIGAIKISGGITGYNYTNNTKITHSTAILAGGRIASIFVGKSIVGGTSVFSGYAIDSSVIHAGQDIGSITVKGDLKGQLVINDPSEFIITAVGQAKHGKSSDVAIGSLHVGGQVAYAEILAGYSAAGTATDGSAQIGSVTVGGAWTAADLVAGVKNATGYFGNASDKLITAAPAPLPKIASITIAGAVTGLGNAGDHYGFVAAQIGSFKANGAVVPLQPGPGNDLIPFDVGGTNDVSLHEVT
jgi:hypothetical protein